MSLRTPLGRARGLGSAKNGTQHWWHQRLTALALLPLAVWFVVSLITLADATYEDVIDWLSSPIVAGLMLLLIFAMFMHLKIGLQEVIEDYVHSGWRKVASLVFVTFGTITLGLACALAVLWVWLVV